MPATIVWRIAYCPTPAPPAAALLVTAGHGSTLQPGRWHSTGQRQVVYCGASRALCQLEKRVNANGAAPKDQALMRLELPSEAPLQDAVALGLVPSAWRDDSTPWQHLLARTRQIGDLWLDRGEALGLWVPSVVEPSESNLLLNPAHKDYSDIRLVLERHPFRFDQRLFA